MRLLGLCADFSLVTPRDQPGLVLSDAKFAVAQFVESSDAKKLLEFAAVIALATTHYERAYGLWGYKFSQGTLGARNLVPYQYQVGSLQKKQYDPVLVNYVEAISKDYNVSLDQDKVLYDIDGTLEKMWAEAAKEITKASSLLQ